MIKIVSLSLLEDVLDKKFKMIILDFMMTRKNRTIKVMDFLTTAWKKFKNRNTMKQINL
jgi:hypothetical protein